MTDGLTTIVKENISGICDSYVLHLACVATDNGFIEIARQKPSCIRAVHRASDLVCPATVRNDASFVDYLTSRIKRSATMPTRQYLVEALRRLESCVTREHVFALATLPKPSLMLLMGAPWLFLGSALGFDTRSRYARFVQDNVNAGTIDEHVVYTEILKGLSGDDVPLNYRNGIAEALKNAATRQ
ncbi:hypothetical protein [Burkholderia ubonensis]|uniref:hypothetical protein n=1 Tax=Burkholderia ubonensis TaxID=101571 RepID=UPI00075D4FF6|nr:hypothetical protein [Burkholderia ubonensis]KVP49139.1 hypothetical protein WJ89_03250 [Burkholderia ubonensis]KVQ79666.1 hypothetical protein WK06_15430 [Burkholderia ubonensis]KVR10877.1 hypothetical protein WK12_17515 [Burkholderia ubonensis]KWD33035.1 hypothetical protein WL63_20775 [Burkholderia ubonensis]KWD39050.1 hypothetical protein WL64_16240 [Burkholderia ubonensis]